MTQAISKSRAKKLRSRQKKSGKPSLKEMLAIKTSPVIGMATCLIVWLIATFIVEMDIIFAGGFDEGVFFLLAGDSIYLLITLIACGVFLKITCPERVNSNANILLMSFVALISILTAKGVLYFAAESSFIRHETAGFMLPFALAPMLIAILLGGREALAVGLWTSFAAAVMTDKSMPILVAGVISTSVASQIAATARTRSKILKAGAVTGVSEIIAVLAFTALSWRDSEAMAVVHQSTACVVSGVASAMIVMLLIPLLEPVFGITTDVTLLELSDMGHPLLQRLAMEAPGTYHHSLVVANLAQAAAAEIGANPLLARVSAYFHDIGKLTKPEFFAENIRMRDNPHDDLPPSMSTLIITSHVKEGVSLAMLHKLPEIVIRVIREHHGTGLISYFHHKAKTQMEFELERSDDSGAKPSINDSDFRYQGPKPSTAESVIVALADAVEAASRTMQKISPANIESLIEEIVTSRFEDGQLSDANLKLSDLTKIKRSFVFSLTNMLHGRIPYPKDEDRDKQPAKPAEDQ
jgi:putative nucleotidyltransferase with HDIG domain